MHARAERMPWELKGMHLSFRRMRQDCTNTGLWAGKKLSVDELLVSGTRTPIQPDSNWEEVWDDMETKCILCELRPILGSTKAPAMMQTLTSHVESVGQRAGWTDISDASPELQAIRDVEPNQSVPPLGDRRVDH